MPIRVLGVLGVRVMLINDWLESSDPGVHLSV